MEGGRGEGGRGGGGRGGKQLLYKLVATLNYYTVEPLNNVTFGTSYSVHY